MTWGGIMTAAAVGDVHDPYVLLDALIHDHRSFRDRPTGAAYGREVSGDLSVAEQLKRYADACEVQLVADLAEPGCAGDPTAMVDKDLAHQGLPPDTPPELVEAIRCDLIDLHAQRLAAAEVAVRLKLTPGEARGRVARSVDLSRNLPRVLEALRHGRIDLNRALLIADRTAVLDDEQRRRVADQALVGAAMPGVTERKLRTVVDTLVVAADPDAAEARRRKAVEGRKVSARASSDGMGTFTATIPAEDLATMMVVLNHFAGISGPVDPLDLDTTGLADDEDHRTFDQRRADACVDIFTIMRAGGTVSLRPLDIDESVSSTGSSDEGRPCSAEASTSPTATGATAAAPGPDAAPGSGAAPEADAGHSCAGGTATPAPCRCCASPTSTPSGRPGFALATRQGRTAHLVITVSAETLAGLSDDPGMLAGHGVMTAQWCRQIATAAGSFTVVAVDSLGRPVDCSPTLYRPRQSVRDRVIVFNPTCVFPGCHRDARGADLDHISPFDHDHPDRGGGTTERNLAPLCRQHHRLKTFGGWSYHRAQDAYVWQSPLGTVIRRPVEPMVPQLRSRPRGRVSGPSGRRPRSRGTPG
jgi:hypothetical protein